jgi:hypothetical protein
MTSCLKSTDDLFASERRFAAAMRDVGFGRFESLQIKFGRLVLDPWPIAVRRVKFGSVGAATGRPDADDFQLKAQLAEFFEYVRGVHVGEIRCLELRHGLPFSMEIEHRHNGSGGGRG